MIATAGFCLTGLASAVLANALSESLWLDELHTSWSIRGDSWRQIASRAAAGNQTPLYFWTVATIAQTLGPSTDWIVRTLSIVAWVGAILLVVRLFNAVPRVAPPTEDSSPSSSLQSARFSTNQPPGPLFVIGVVAWIVVDRLQWFYATEARPYALVQLITLAGWYCVVSLQQTARAPMGTNQSRTKQVWLVGGWTMLAIVSVYLHLTALLPVGCQWLVGCAVLVARPEQPITTERHNAKSLISWFVAGSAVAIACLPVVSIAAPVWQRRAQWASFASDTSLANGLAMFPVLAILSPILIAVLIDRCWPIRKLRDGTKSSDNAQGARWLWWCAMLGPWLLAWTLAAFEIAPMFHRRFVIASALPLVIVGAMELKRVHLAYLRGVTLVAVAVAVVFSQGSVGIWRQGYLVGQLRGENWRGAAAWLSHQIEPGERVLCSSGLIEATNVTLPLESELAEYLAFPLGGVYQVRDSAGDLAPVTALLADAELWAEQIFSSVPQSPEQNSPPLPEQENAAEIYWLVYRGAKGRMLEKVAVLDRDLQQQSSAASVSEVQAFGRVWVAKLSIQRLAQR